MPSHNPQTNLSKRDGDLRQQIGKTPICAGQSDLERLELRKSYRILRGDIVEESRAEEDNYPEWRQRHNHLWDQVRYPREAVCDAGIFEVLTGHVTQQIDGMIEVPRYDASRLCKKLKQKMGGGRSFNWNKLGKSVSQHYFQSAIPSCVHFYSGPLQEHNCNNSSLPKRRKRKLIVDTSDSEDEEEPEVLAKKQHQNKRIVLTQIEKNIVLLESILKSEKQPISAIPFFFNPDSYTQTIENMFHFSFLLKKGEAKLYTSKDGLPMVQYHNEGESDKNNPQQHHKPRQAILSLSMNDWRRLKKTFEVKQGLIPDRTAVTEATKLPSIIDSKLYSKECSPESMANIEEAKVPPAIDSNFHSKNLSAFEEKPRLDNDKIATSPEFSRDVACLKSPVASKAKSNEKENTQDIMPCY